MVCIIKAEGSQAILSLVFAGDNTNVNLLYIGNQGKEPSNW